jgi:hypothetical protein
MSLASRIRRWLALRLRPEEPAPDAQDLNLPRPLPEGSQSRSELRLDPAQQRRYRHACWRAGPWQQK